MKKVICTIITALTLHSTMAIDSIEVKNLQGSLNQEDQLGFFEYDQLSYNDASLSFNSSFSQIESSFIDAKLSIRYHDTSFSYDLGSQSALAGIKNIVVDSFNLNYQKSDNFSFSTEAIELSHSGGTQTLPQMNLICSNSKKDIINNISDLCLRRADLSIPQLQFDQLSSKSVAKALNKLNPIDSIENLRVIISDNNYQIQFKAKYLFNWTVYAQGTVEYNQEKRRLSLFLNTAKVSLISLKNTILTQISNANLESITVDGSYIYIQF